jgi:hypothetical protein
MDSKNEKKGLADVTEEEDSVDISDEEEKKDQMSHSKLNNKLSVLNKNI